MRSCDLNDSDCSDHVTKEQDDIKGHATYQWNENHKKKRLLNADLKIDKHYFTNARNNINNGIHFYTI